MADKDSVAALVERSRTGDRGAFSQLVRLYRPRIFALTLHLTGNESDADDVTQEVFLRAFNALHQFEGRSAFFTWVYRMAVNRSLNARRDRARRARTTVLGDPRLDKAVAVDAAGDPAKASELRQTYTRLLAALDSLAPSMRTTVVLVALQGLSHAETAAIQGCSPGTIAWRIHTARHQLRKALSRPKSITPISSDLRLLLHRCGLPHNLPN